MIGSICLYIALLAVCLFFADRAQKTDKSIWVWCIVACLSLIVGLRAESVGIDTPSYIEMFNHIAEGNPNFVYGTERSFLLIVKILQIVSKSPTFLFLVFSFVTNALMIFRIWEFRRAISFSWSILYFYACFYFFTFNIIRQMVAVAMVFWGTRYVQEKNYWKFLVVVAVAALFHQSALLGIVYIVADVLLWKKTRQIYKNLIREITQDNKIFVAICSVVSVLLLVFLAIKASKYRNYFTNITLDIGFLVPLKLALVCGFAYLLKHMSGKWGGVSKNAMRRYLNQNVVIYYGIGLVISLLGYSFTFMDRIGLYFTPFGCLFIGYINQKTKRSWVTLAILGVVVIMPLVMDLFSGGQGQLPYAFFWQK